MLTKVKLLTALTAAAGLMTLFANRHCEAQIYTSYVNCPPGTFVNYQPVRTAYGVNYVPYCQYPTAYPYYYRPGVTFYFSTRPSYTYYRSPNYSRYQSRYSSRSRYRR